MTEPNQRIATGIIQNFMDIKVPAGAKRTEARLELLRTMSLATLVMPHLCQNSRDDIAAAAKQKINDIYPSANGLAKSKLADQDVYKRFYQSMKTDALTLDLDDPTAILGQRIMHAPTSAPRLNGGGHSDKAIAAG